MKKLVRGIVDFRQKMQPGYREKFASLALGQSPDTLFIACSDSRVVPNLFASTDPGDVFVIRNVGNLVPCCGVEGHSSADESEAAAIEYALMRLHVSHIIVCGHSECGAMQAIYDPSLQIPAPNFKAWLRHGEGGLKKVDSQNTELSPINQLSQYNVIQQIEHLKSYPIVQDRLAQSKLQVHAWWFDLSSANVLAYDEEIKKFTVIDEAHAGRILERL